MMTERYVIDDSVGRYYSKFDAPIRMRKNNNKQTRREISDSESEDEYDSDELESLSNTLSKLNKKVDLMREKKDKSRGRKHRKRRGGY